MLQVAGDSFFTQNVTNINELDHGKPVSVPAFPRPGSWTRVPPGATHELPAPRVQWWLFSLAGVRSCLVADPARAGGGNTCDSESWVLGLGAAQLRDREQDVPFAELGNQGLPGV